MGNKAVDARSLPAEEPSVRSPIPVQPQQRALIPPPVRAARPSSGRCCPLGGAMAPQELVCARVRACTRGLLYQYYFNTPVKQDAKAQLEF